MAIDLVHTQFGDFLDTTIIVTEVHRHAIDFDIGPLATDRLDFDRCADSNAAVNSEK